MPFNCPSSKLFCRPERSVQVSFFDNFPPLLAFAFLQKWLAWPYPILKENQRQTPSYHFNEAPPETKIPIKCVRKGFIPPLGILESSEMLPFCTDPGSFRSTSTKEPPCLLLSLHPTASFQHWGVSNPESLCFSPSGCALSCKPTFIRHAGGTSPPEHQTRMLKSPACYQIICSRYGDLRGKHLDSSSLQNLEPQHVAPFVLPILSFLHYYWFSTYAQAAESLDHILVFAKQK